MTAKCWENLEGKLHFTMAFKPGSLIANVSFLRTEDGLLTQSVILKDTWFFLPMQKFYTKLDAAFVHLCFNFQFLSTFQVFPIL